MCLPLSYTFTRLVVPKSFRYAQSRRSGKPPGFRGRWQKSLIFDGGREKQEEKYSLPQSFAAQNPAPSSEGALGVQITASAVVGQYTQAKDHSMSL